jgi:hypothetical protein
MDNQQSTMAKTKEGPSCCHLRTNNIVCAKDVIKPSASLPPTSYTAAVVGTTICSMCDTVGRYIDLEGLANAFSCCGGAASKRYIFALVWPSLTQNLQQYWLFFDNVIAPVPVPIPVPPVLPTSDPANVNDTTLSFGTAVFTRQPDVFGTTLAAENAVAPTTNITNERIVTNMPSPSP